MKEEENIKEEESLGSAGFSGFFSGGDIAL